MDITFPRSREEGGANLAGLFTADKRRGTIFDNIVSRLEPDGRLGDQARLYAVANPFRLGVLRTVLSAIGQPFPAWSRTGRGAERLNAHFVAAYNAV